MTDFDSLINPVIEDSNYRVKPVTEDNKPKIMGKTCRKCEKFYRQDNFLPTHSAYFPDGYLEICNDCLSKILGDCRDLEKADKLCQYGDYPFDPNEWITMERAEKHNTFKKYCETKWALDYKNNDWKRLQTKWNEILYNKDEDNNVGLLLAQKVRELRKEWGDDYTDKELLRFEQLYDDIDKSQSIVTAIQRDCAKKMCILSNKIEKALVNDERGSDIKSLISAYDQLAKSADFTPKTAKNIGDFESVGELCAFLEKKGMKYEYYDWVPKDDIDKVMQDLQAYLKRIVLGETNIAEELNSKLDMVQQMTRLEQENLNSSEEVKIDKVHIDEEDADEYNEKFDLEDF